MNKIFQNINLCAIIVFFVFINNSILKSDTIPSVHKTITINDNTDSLMYFVTGKLYNDEIEWSNITDTIYYTINRKNVYFYSNGKYHPFSLKIRPYGYFIFSDIKFGFSHKEDEGDYIYEFGFDPPPNALIISNGRIYNYIEEIDTIYSYFSRHINNSQEVDTFYLAKELEYSYLLRKINHKPLLKTGNNKELRIIYANKCGMYAEELHLMRVMFRGDSAKIFFSKINTEKAQNIEITDIDSAWLSKRNLETLRERMSNVDFKNINHLNNNHCPELYRHGVRRFEYLIEYNYDNNYYFAILCDHWGNIYHEKKELRTDLLELKSIFHILHRIYFRTPWWKRLWESIFG